MFFKAAQARSSVSSGPRKVKVAVGLFAAAARRRYIFSLNRGKLSSNSSDEARHHPGWMMTVRGGYQDARCQEGLLHSWSRGRCLMIPELQLKGEIQLRFAAEDVRRSQGLPFWIKACSWCSRPGLPRKTSFGQDLSYLSLKKGPPSRFGFQARNEKTHAREAGERPAAQPAVFVRLRLAESVRKRLLSARFVKTVKSGFHVSGGGTHLVLRKATARLSTSVRWSRSGLFLKKAKRPPTGKSCSAGWTETVCGMCA